MPRLDRFTWWCTLAGIAAIAILVPFWLRMMVSPAPQEMREGALLWSTRSLLALQNPYAVATLPGPANVYGPLYPLLVLPFAAVFGPTLFVHRLVNGLGIVTACWLIFRVLRRDGVSPTVALAGAAINLAGLLYWVGPTARPDGVGVALMVGAYAVMAPDPRSPRRFAAGVALALCGFATKLYYVMPAFVAVAWLLLRGDHRRALSAALAAVGALAGLALTLAWLFPAWAPVVLGVNLRSTTYDLAHLMRQSGDWAIFSLPLLVAAVAAWRPWREPLDLWAVALLSGAAVIAGVLGGHRGAHMTYFFHLVTPPLTIVALRSADRVSTARATFAAALVAAVALNSHWFNLDLDRLARAEGTFAHVSDLVERARHPGATGEFAPLLFDADVPPFETGHAEYFHVNPPPRWLAALWGNREGIEVAGQRTTRRFYTELYSASFCLVVANRRRLGLFTPEGLSARYRVIEQLSIDLAWAQQSWPADVWVPRELPAAPPYRRSPTACVASGVTTTTSRTTD